RTVEANASDGQGEDRESAAQFGEGDLLADGFSDVGNLRLKLRDRNARIGATNDFTHCGSVGKRIARSAQRILGASFNRIGLVEENVGDRRNVFRKTSVGGVPTDADHLHVSRDGSRDGTRLASLVQADVPA